MTNLLVLVCAFALLTVVRGRCVDKQSNCPGFKDFCKLQGHTGDVIRKLCPKTCGECEAPPTPPVPTLPPGATFPPHVGGCGKPDVIGITRVIAGKTAVPHSWPWQILMLYGGRSICGGTLVSPQWVVTAAHCVYRNERSGMFSIVVGKQDREMQETTQQTVKVVKVFRHPSYDPRRLNNDIAMFKLEHPVRLNKYVSPACLPKADVPVGTDCFITGWGKIRHPGSMTRFLQQGLLPVVSNKKCDDKNRHTIGIPITDAMICGGDGGISRLSGCHGDSGGPFVCRVNGVWELHGSVSHGSSRCSSTDSYTVFSRTYHFMDWIKTNMKNN